MSVPTQLSIDGTQLPAPTLTSPGGIQAVSPVAHEWVNSINTSGVPQLSQPAFSDVSGTAAAGQVPALSALSGQITAGQLPVGGFSGTITTAKLTTGGTNGSMTFTDGQLTSQTAAT